MSFSLLRPSPNIAVHLLPQTMRNDGNKEEKIFMKKPQLFSTQKIPLAACA